MKTIDVLALGEILIDFTSAGTSPSGHLLYERNAGGAPANVAVAVARLGGKAAFVGKTGKDSFGSFLRETLDDRGVETGGMRVDSANHTTLAFVTLAPNGERSFSFCRNPGADTRLSSNELDGPLLSSARFLHIGSLSLTHEPARTATLDAIRLVKESGGYISYDPNWRESLWASRENGISAMKSLLPLADIVKVSDEELTLLFGSDTKTSEGLSSGAGKILEAGARLVLVTLGPRGVFYQTPSSEGILGAPDVKVVDTTGAGDSFVGALLYRLSRCSADADPFVRGLDELESDIRFANAAASVCVTGRGAIPAMPSLNDVLALLSR